MPTVGQTYTANDYSKEFKCSTRSGMNYSKTTKSMVIITKENTTEHGDYWKGNVLHYTGQGAIGDQKLSRANKRLANANAEGTSLHIYSLVGPKQYIYRGEAELVKCYTEKQLDIAGNSRTVYKFELKLK